MHKVTLTAGAAGAILLLLSLAFARVASETCDCELSESKRIVGGTEADLHEYPWQAFIISFIGRPKKQYLCGGTLISSRWVLSAAHCFVKPSKKKKKKKMYVKAKDLIIRLGEHNYADDDESTYTITVRAAKIKIHRKYNTKTYDNDIALIKLKDPVDLTKNISPACLPFNYEGRDFHKDTVTVTGWGKMSFKGNYSVVLKETDLTLYETGPCAKFGLPLTQNMICAYTLGKDACQGDSGGPAVWKDGGHSYIVGIVSWGKGCGGRDSPGVYTKVVRYLDWISDKTNEELCYPNNDYEM